MEWAASTAVGANNGFVRLIATNVGTGTAVTQQKLNIDNDTRRIQRLRVGGVAGMDSATTGSYSLDAVTTSAGVGQTTTTISYTYDALYRLTSATYSTGERYTYAYDAVGNRTNETLCTAWDGATCTGDETSTTYTYDEANRLMTSQPTLNGLPGPMTTYTWDDAGRLLSDGTNTYTWDAAHRLTRLDDGTTVHSYAYDGLGNRYVADGETYVLDIAAGLTQVLADPTTTYLYGATRIAADSTTWTYYHTDGLGSVRALSDATGQPISAHAYSPYGDATTAAPDDFGYTGEQTGAGGLVYLRARYYDPGVGVFMSADPSRLEANLYAYVGGNPVNRVDPSGLCQWRPGFPEKTCIVELGDYLVSIAREHDVSHFDLIRWNQQHWWQNYGRTINDIDTIYPGELIYLFDPYDVDVVLPQGENASIAPPEAVGGESQESTHLVPRDFILGSTGLAISLDTSVTSPGLFNRLLVTHCDLPAGRTLSGGLNLVFDFYTNQMAVFSYQGVNEQWLDVVSGDAGLGAGLLWGFEVNDRTIDSYGGISYLQTFQLGGPSVGAGVGLSFIVSLPAHPSVGGVHSWGAGGQVLSGNMNDGIVGLFGAVEGSLGFAVELPYSTTIAYTERITPIENIPARAGVFARLFFNTLKWRFWDSIVE